MGRRNGKRRWVSEKCGRQEAAGLRSRVPRRKRKPLLRDLSEAKGKRERERERKEEREMERNSLLAARRPCCCFAEDRTWRGRIEWFGRRERERIRSKRAFIAGRTS